MFLRFYQSELRTNQKVLYFNVSKRCLCENSTGSLDHKLSHPWSWATGSSTNHNLENDQLLQRLIGTQCTVTKCTAGLKVPPARIGTVMAVRLFEDKDHAAAYLQYRVAPQQLISRILNFVSKKVRKWNDVNSNVRTCCLPNSVQGLT